MEIVRRSEQYHVTELPFGPSLLALGRVHGLGSKGLFDLVSHLGRDLGILLEGDRVAILAALKAAKIPSAERVGQHLAEDRKDLISLGNREFDGLTDRSITLLGPGEIPPRLRDLPDGPRWLFAEGHRAALNEGPFVAVVGTRQPSPLGVKATEAVVRTMAAYPMTLVSGLANGIDAAAHRFALRDNVRNVAFLGHGINLIFPAETSHIRQSIIESGGAVVSEYLPDEHYKKHYFVARNRLQAGLANVVVAADGSASGGTAHTVRFAARYTRPTIGLTFEGAGNLSRLVAEQATGELVEIFDDAGRRRLDHLFRALCTQLGKSTNGLTLVEHLLDRELRLRQIPRADLEQLTTRLTRLIEEAS
ncbi:DNA-processing protein DprA [Catellatospora sichuanensis]|uniref:DNA-processing protein DprA n=1 Tax=Catellatospora sichuanensis TaxID=1969805 RepID=UPI0011829791|nr:DNA-processing protein DprA [Catellatospora sichuanensis]